MTSLMVEGAAVFVDRDGTLNYDKEGGYITSPGELVLIPGVPEAIARINQLGIPIMLVTNQSAIARGMMTTEDLAKIHHRLSEILELYAAHIDRIFFCPHHPDDRCHCRKPKVGLLQQAVKQFALNVSYSYFIGDKASDLEAAQTMGIPGVLVMTSPYSQSALKARKEGHLKIAFVSETFSQAVEWIEGDLRNRVSMLSQNG